MAGETLTIGSLSMARAIPYAITMLMALTPKAMLTITHHSRPERTGPPTAAPPKS